MAAKFQFFPSIGIKQDLNEFDQIMAHSGLFGLQNDSLAELESTLNLASELTLMKGLVTNSSTTTPTTLGDFISMNDYQHQTQLVSCIRFLSARGRL